MLKCVFLNRKNEFKEFLSQQNELVLCNDICCVTEALGHQHDKLSDGFY
jgi:hypothetical protein